MKINIRTKNIKLTDPLDQFTQEKIGSVDKFLETEERSNHPSVEAFVELEKTTQHHHKGSHFRAECNLEVKGKTLRAESVREDIREAIVEVKDELQRELKDLKEKSTDLGRKRKRFLKKIFRDALFWKKEE